MSEADERAGLVGTIPALLRRMHDARVTSLDVRVGAARLAVRTTAVAHAVVEANADGGRALADDAGLHTVVSPLSGVAYYSPGPEQPPYVGIGEVGGVAGVGGAAEVGETPRFARRKGGRHVGEGLAEAEFAVRTFQLPLVGVGQGHLVRPDAMVTTDRKRISHNL